MKVGLWAAVGTVLLLGGCASTSGNPHDPFESVNRAVFKFNDVVDTNVAKPIARGYTFVLPQLVRDGITNFFSNVGDVWIGANNLMQGKVYAAASDLMRVSMNTVFGLGGLLDVASSAQLQKHDEDFGQTLGRWGVPSGPYIVLPFLGPSSARDGPALAVDFYGSPMSWLVRQAFQPHYVGVRTGVYALYFVNTRANLLATGELLEVAAVDRYSFVRDAYLQRRRNQVYDGEPPPEKEDDGRAAPSADEDAVSRAAPSGEDAVACFGLSGDQDTVLRAAPFVDEDAVASAVPTAAGDTVVRAEPSADGVTVLRAEPPADGGAVARADWQDSESLAARSLPDQPLIFGQGRSPALAVQNDRSLQ